MKLTTFSILFLFVAGVASDVTPAATIQTDATIDANSRYSGEQLIIKDGAEGPATVRIVEGGDAFGVRVQDGSTSILEGGVISFTSKVQDNARLIISSGSIGCFAEGCQDADIAYLVEFTDESTLYVSGGLIGLLPLALADASTATFVGSDFSMLPKGSQTYLVTGTLLDGTPLGASLQIAGDPTGRVFFVEVPEPPTVILFCSGLLGFFGSPYLFHARLPRTGEQLATPL